MVLVISGLFVMQAGKKKKKSQNPKIQKRFKIQNPKTTL